jgi:hypothetical protein
VLSRPVEQDNTSQKQQISTHSEQDPGEHLSSESSLASPTGVHQPDCSEVHRFQSHRARGRRQGYLIDVGGQLTER